MLTFVLAWPFDRTRARLVLSLRRACKACEDFGIYFDDQELTVFFVGLSVLGLWLLGSLQGALAFSK